MISVGLKAVCTVSRSWRTFCTIPGRGGGEGRGFTNSHYDRKFHTMGGGGDGKGVRHRSTSFPLLYPVLVPQPSKTRQSLIFSLWHVFISARNFCSNFTASLSVHSVATPVANSLFLCVALYLSTLSITWRWARAHTARDQGLKRHPFRRAFCFVSNFPSCFDFKPDCLVSATWACDRLQNFVLVSFSNTFL